MRRVWKDNSLAIVAFGLFFAFWVFGQSITGLHTYNEDQIEHDEPTISYGRYITTAHFGEATFENWESEFLQMGAYVVLTVWLRQRGSAESKPIDESDPSDEDPRKHREDPNAPWPVHRGGLVLKLYERSLSIAFFALFAASFLLHAATGARDYSNEQVAHGGEPIGMLSYLGRARFWFESMQNWQSEFLAVGSIVVLSIFLRQRGSPESKPVHMANAETG
jgi:hypothetical protein